MTLVLRPLRGLLKNISFVVAPSSLQISKHGRYLFKRFESSLSRSYVLIQDGTEIKELPWIVRKLNSNEVLVNNTPTNPIQDSIETKPNSLEEQFKTILQRCNSMEEVIQLLEMPGKSVTPTTAASVLCRIGMFNSIGEHLGSFIRRAVLNELCEMVSRDFKILSNKTVLDLIKCCLRPNCYETKFTDAIKAEVERRIVCNSFSVADLCEMVTVLSEHTGGKFTDILDVCWVHLGSRFLEFNERNIAEVFEVLRYTTDSTKYLIKVVDRQVGNCCAEMTPGDVATVSKWLTFFDHHSISTMVAISKWLYLNVHSLNIEQMRHILGMFLHFDFTNVGVTKSLEKFVRAYTKCTERGGNQLKDRTLLHMAATLCRQKRLLLPGILDAIALDFSLSWKSYGLTEGVSVLKTFGQLAYLPNCSSKLFTTAEMWMEENLFKLGLADTFELLASFVYIERYPINFLQRVVSTRLPEIFSGRLDHKSKATVVKNLLELQNSFLLEFPRRPLINIVSKESFQINFTWLGSNSDLCRRLHGRSLKFHKDVSVILKEILGEGKFFEVWNPRHMPYVVNFQILVDAFKRPLEMDVQKQCTRLAMVLIMPDNLTSQGTFMGQTAMKLRHLEKKDFTTITVDYETFKVKCKSSSERTSYITSLLSDHVDLTKE